MRAGPRILVLAAVALAPAAVAAEEPSFRVPQVAVDVSIEPDGAAIVDYRIDVDNVGHSMIDVLEVRMPSADFEATTCRGEIGGAAVAAVRPSDARSAAVEVDLGARQIPSGRRVTLRVRCRNPGVVEEEPSESDAVRFVFSPAWFDAREALGLTSLQVRLRLPGDPQRAELSAIGEPFDLVGEYEGRTMVLWERTLPLVGPTSFGVRFPRRCVQSFRRRTLLRRAVRALAEHPGVQALSATAFLVAFAFAFFRVEKTLGREAGCGAFLGAELALLALFVYQPATHLVAWPLLGAVIVVAAVRRVRSRLGAARE